MSADETQNDGASSSFAPEAADLLGQSGTCERVQEEPWRECEASLAWNERSSTPMISRHCKQL